MPKGNRARTVEDDLTRERLRKILLHCDIRLKALVLFLVSSGIRAGEALKLTLDDVTLETNPAVVYVRGEYAKEGEPYVTYISTEAKEALQEWLRVRAGFLADSAYRAFNLKNGRKAKPWKVEVTPPSESAIFPFSYVSAGVAFRNALKGAGLLREDKVTHIHTIHLHMLRKYFMSQMKLKIPETLVEAYAGHTGYLDDAYRRYNSQQRAEYYRKGEPAVLIFQDAEKLEQLSGEADTRTKQFDEIVRYNSTLVAELGNLRARVARWEAFNLKVSGMSTDELTDLGQAITHHEILEQDRETAEARAQEVAEWDRQQAKGAPIVKVPKKRARS